MSEARDAMLAALSVCIEAAPEAGRTKLLTAIKVFMGEHVERKTSLSRFMAHLIAPAPSAEKQAVAAKTTNAPKAAAPKAATRAKAKKTS
jgi:hypothetical protein